MLTHEQIEQQIKEVLEDIRPYFYLHGGDIKYVAYEQGKLYVTLCGACEGCTSASYTLKWYVEEAVKKEVPQVLEVIEVNSSDNSIIESDNLLQT